MQARRIQQAIKAEGFDWLFQKVGSRVDSELVELLHGGGKPMSGFGKDIWEAEVEAVLNFPNKPYCIVRDWRIIELDVDENYRDSLVNDGLAPYVLYAAEVVLHSSGKRRKGEWVRSTFQRSFTHGYLFESTNTVYVLLGRGLRKKGSARAVMEIGR
jgi:hypothetical protein